MLTALGTCRASGATLLQLIGIGYGGSYARIDGQPAWADSTPYTIEAKAADQQAYTLKQLFEMFRPLLETRFKLKYHYETRDLAGYALVVGKGGVKLKEISEPTGPSGIRSSPTNTTGPLTIANLASTLGVRLGAPVVDNTGLAGRYQIDLNWSPDPPPGSNPAEPASGPSIFTAVQEQLGLRLEPQKVPVQFFVIDHVEKPTLDD